MVIGLGNDMLMLLTTRLTRPTSCAGDGAGRTFRAAGRSREHSRPCPGRSACLRSRRYSTASSHPALEPSSSKPCPINRPNAPTRANHTTGRGRIAILQCDPRSGACRVRPLVDLPETPCLSANRYGTGVAIGLGLTRRSSLPDRGSMTRLPAAPVLWTRHTAGAVCLC